MKHLAVIKNSNVSFDEALFQAIERFNELRWYNKTVEYKDISIIRSFRNVWVVLVYEYDDTISASVTLPEPTNIKSTHIGMMPGLDPADPDWREKQALWEASRNVQVSRGRTEIKD